MAIILPSLKILLELAKSLKLSLVSLFFVLFCFVLIFPTFFLEQEIHLERYAHGPVVYVHPREINFGTIKALKDRSKLLHLENVSEAPAHFRIEMVSACGAVFQ